MIGTSSFQSEGYTARPGRYRNTGRVWIPVVDVPVIMQPAFLQSVPTPLDRVLDIPFVPQSQVQETVEVPQLPFFRVSSRVAFGRIQGFSS